MAARCNPAAGFRGGSAMRHAATSNLAPVREYRQILEGRPAEDRHPHGKWHRGHSRTAHPLGPHRLDRPGDRRCFSEGSCRLRRRACHEVLLRPRETLHLSALWCHAQRIQILYGLQIVWQLHGSLAHRGGLNDRRKRPDPHHAGPQALRVCMWATQQRPALQRCSILVAIVLAAQEAISVMRPQRGHRPMESQPTALQSLAAVAARLALVVGAARDRRHM